MFFLTELMKLINEIEHGLSINMMPAYFELKHFFYANGKSKILTSSLLTIG